jgi:DNA-directed RNA polymerase subunit alpha
MLWKGFQRPKLLEFERETLTDRFGALHAQPFERGFGTTVVTRSARPALLDRRARRSPAVKIDGVLHEFSPIPGVVEDATDIILNLKQIPLKMHTDTTKTLYCASTRPAKCGRATSRGTPTSRILEPDAHIATVAEHGKLHMELRIKRGRGYVSADKNFDEDLGIGWIPIDSVHSPVKKVNYLVEAARIGQNTDYDKLTVDVWTNGSVTPRDAVSLSAKLIRDHLNIFINLEDVAELQAEAGGDTPGRDLQREPRQERRGAGALGPLLQLPQEREHPHDSRAGAEDRRRDAQDQELRPEVAQRDQGDPDVDGSQPRHAPRPAGGPVTGIEPCATE